MECYYDYHPTPGSVTIAYYNYSADHPINYHQLSSIINSSTYYQSWLIASINHPSSIPPVFFRRSRHEILIRHEVLGAGLPHGPGQAQRRRLPVVLGPGRSQVAVADLGHGKPPDKWGETWGNAMEMPWKCHEKGYEQDDDGWWMMSILMIDDLGWVRWRFLGNVQRDFPVVAKAPHSDPPPKCRCGSRGQCWCPLGDTWRDP